MSSVRFPIRPALAVAVSLVALTPAVPALAEGPAAPSTLSMLEAMVANGVISQAQADRIIRDAAARDAARAEPAPAGEGDGRTRQAEAAPAAGTRRVMYVPETVKRQLRDEIKGEVMAQAKAEGWAAPGEMPEWTRRIRFSGDVRGRYEDDLYPKNNTVAAPSQIDFNAVNTGTPLALSHNGSVGHGNIPYTDVDQSRDRMRLRARLGVEADVDPGVVTGLRLATGEGSAPVSTNQSLGASGGNFSKYQVWLDRAYLRWSGEVAKDMTLTASLGRFDNPFFATDLIWDDDLGFDGLAVTGRYQATPEVAPFLTLGAFPVYNTALNLSSTQSRKSASHDKWLYAAQAGTDWKPTPEVATRFGIAYYHFNNVEGKLSSPCDIRDIGDLAKTSASVTCSTDAFRPSFAQKGNTYMGLRDLSATPYGNGTLAVSADEYQYYGLVTPFHELALTGRVDYDAFAPIRISFDAEYVQNLAFDKMVIASKAVNNDENGAFVGGPIGYMARMTVGTPKLAERWDWSVSLAYRYLESDAVVDGLTDSDFGMGGTNLKGFILGGNLALGRNLLTSVRWMSADSVAGAKYSVDTLMADLTARF